MDLNRLALEHSNSYMHNAKVEAVLLGGSVSQNWQDNFSDIELFILWRENPTEEDRKRPITLAKGSIIDFHPYEEEEWSETYVAQGVKFEISNFLTSTIQKISNEVTLALDTDLNKQCLVVSVHEGIPLGGEQVIYQLKEQVKEFTKTLYENKNNSIQNIDFLHDTIVWSWSSTDQFFNKGIGYCIVHHNEIISICSSSFVYENVQCIGIETLQAHQGKKLATIAAHRFIKDCF